MIHKQKQQDKANTGLVLMLEEHAEKYFKAEVFETISYLFGRVRGNPYSPQLQNALQEVYKTNIASRGRLNGYELNKGLKENYLV